MIVVEEVLKCGMAIIDYKKSIIYLTLYTALIDFELHTTKVLKPWTSLWIKWMRYVTQYE